MTWNLVVKNDAYPYDGVKFSHCNLLGPLDSCSHLLLMLQQIQNTNIATVTVTWRGALQNVFRFCAQLWQADIPHITQQVLRAVQQTTDVTPCLPVNGSWHCYLYRTARPLEIWATRSFATTRITTRRHTPKEFS